MMFLSSFKCSVRSVFFFVSISAKHEIVLNFEIILIILEKILEYWRKSDENCKNGKCFCELF